VTENKLALLFLREPQRWVMVLRQALYLATLFGLPWNEMQTGAVLLLVDMVLTEVSRAYSTANVNLPAASEPEPVEEFKL
jgi:hypothetical protein